MVIVAYIHGYNGEKTKHLYQSVADHYHANKTILWLIVNQNIFSAENFRPIQTRLKLEYMALYHNPDAAIHTSSRCYMYYYPVSKNHKHILLITTYFQKTLGEE